MIARASAVGLREPRPSTVSARPFRCNAPVNPTSNSPTQGKAAIARAATRRSTSTTGIGTMVNNPIAATSALT